MTPALKTNPGATYRPKNLKDVHISKRPFQKAYFMLISALEQLFMCVLAISVSSLKKRLFRSSAHVCIGLFVFFNIKLHELFIYIGD